MALDFDGTTDQLGSPAPPTSLKSIPLTLAAWVNSDADHVGGVLCVEGENSTAVHGHGIIRVTGDMWAFSQNNTNVQAVRAATNTAWHSCVGVFAGTSDRSIWVDGAETNETSSKVPDTTYVERIRIGQRANDNNDQNFNGKIAECAAWDIALSDSEVAAHAAGVSALLIAPRNLVAYWPLGGPMISSSVYKDIVGGFDMTATGTPTAYDHPPIIYPSSPTVFRAAAAAAAAAATLTGTVTSSITKSDIVTGAKTIILTTSGETWVA